MIVKGVKTPLLVTDERSRKKVLMDIKDLNNSINQPDLVDIYRMPLSTTSE